MSARFLLIDDEESSKFILKELLTKCSPNTPIEEFQNGEDALNGIVKLGQEGGSSNSKILTIIFVDLRMPVMNGFEFLDELKKKSKVLDTLAPIISCVITSSENELDIDKALEYKIVKDYIVKYPSLNELQSKIEKLLKYDGN